MNVLGIFLLMMMMGLCWGRYFHSGCVCRHDTCWSCSMISLNAVSLKRETCESVFLSFLWRTAPNLFLSLKPTCPSSRDQSKLLASLSLSVRFSYSVKIVPYKVLCQSKSWSSSYTFQLLVCPCSVQNPTKTSVKFWGSTFLTISLLHYHLKPREKHDKSDKRRSGRTLRKENLK